MAIRPILQVPNDEAFLRQVSREVDPNASETLEAMGDLKDTLAGLSMGRAISAPQIGQHMRLCYIDMGRWLPEDDKQGFEELEMINPVILNRSWFRLPRREGCLSIASTLKDAVARPWVWRSYWVTVGYYTPVKRVKPTTVVIDGKSITVGSEGPPTEYREKTLWWDEAQATQHEVDHHNGVLIPEVPLWEVLLLGALPRALYGLQVCWRVVAAFASDPRHYMRRFSR
jgi:peptide deformylase